ncbi:trimeric LpxA-like protein [Coniochaeta ligniaria NRRL 30616]|uniref:Dynactin subunit 6 n=1 Tax=Coniochaeta ligniaria NRRL 30616 TaxID=1408157 RepID=A0A1J7IAG6_9PEZI|nr:trimeric LpxA-like protein [Coniochaeta ligniaria NRRL 30616]
MASAKPSASRHSILPPISQSGPKPPVTFSSSITISDGAVLTGTNPILISSESVIHPRARLDSMGGTISIGKRCIIHERTRIGDMGSEGRLSLQEGNKAVTLEDYVTVETAAVVEAGDTLLGEGTVVGVGSRIGRGAVVGKYCTITPQSEVPDEARIPDFTVVYGNGMRRQDKRGVSALMNKAQRQQIDVLRRLIPSKPEKFH